jgi:hypothetical protein
MNRINTSHQSIAAKQRNCNYHPSGTVAQHILNTTVYDESLTEEVVLQDDGTFLVQSAKFAHRYYLVAEIDGQWICSSKEAAVADRCIERAQASRLVAMAA